MILNHNLYINGRVYVKGQELTKEDATALKKSGSKFSEVKQKKATAKE